MGIYMDLTGNHVKAARALLGIDQEHLSELSGVSINTIRTQEASGDQPIAGYASTRDKVQRALEALGIEFTNGGAPGVRLVKRGKRPAQDARASDRKRK
jgi:transcriptional regulator with XRE-family HTH domain